MRSGRLLTLTKLEGVTTMALSITGEAMCISNIMLTYVRVCVQPSD